MLTFTDFLSFDAAATALYDDPDSQRRCRACLTRLSETARRHPGKFLAEAAQRDVRKGVAFRQKSLDDTEHAVFAQRLAGRLPTKPAGGNYGDFLYQNVRTQGDVLGGLQWENWEVTKAAMKLGGVDPNDLNDPNKSPAERLALVNHINWANVTVPRLKAKLGPSFHVDDAWKRQFGIERLQRIKEAVERGQPITDPQERGLLGIWRTLEVQLGKEILPAGPESDVGMTRLPMSQADRTRFYKTLTGTNESVETPLRLSAQSAYDYLTKYGVDVVSDQEATDLYLTRILHDLQSRTAFIPSSPRGSEADTKRWRDSAARSWGGFLPAARNYDPANAPGFAQWAAGMTTRGFKTRSNPSGRQVPYAFNEPEEFQRRGDVPGIKYVIDAPSQEIPNEEINAFYRSGTPEANAAVQRELVAPARDAVNWLKRNGWDIDPAKMDDCVQQVVVGMLARTGAAQNWRANVGFRRATASMLARRYASQGWPAATKERTGHLGRGEGQPDTVDLATGTDRGGEDEFSRMRGGTARARAAIQKAIASVLDIDTSNMGDDEAKFVDAIDSLSDPDQAIRALDTLDRLSTRHAAALPRVRKAVDRIQRHLKPLMTKVRGV
ncbi:MAG: hypothetical protein ABSF26_24880 [Thermoguttaceae bacterium]|jgi:hypothetical protein